MDAASETNEDHVGATDLRTISRDCGRSTYHFARLLVRIGVPARPATAGPWAARGVLFRAVDAPCTRGYPLRRKRVLRMMVGIRPLLMTQVYAQILKIFD